MIERILTVILSWLMAWLESRATDEVQKRKRIYEDNKNDAENARAYEEAETRLDEIKSAKHMLNGTRNP